MSTPLDKDTILTTLAQDIAAFNAAAEAQAKIVGSAIEAVSTDIAALTALLAGGTVVIPPVDPPPVDPPPAPDTPSLSGAAIKAPGNHTLIDAGKHVFSFGLTKTSGYGWPVMRDGAPYMGGQAVLLVIQDGICWQQNNAGQWYKDNPGKSWDFQASAPTVAEFSSTTVLPPVILPPLPALDVTVPQIVTDTGYKLLWECIPDIKRIDLTNSGGPASAFDFYISGGTLYSGGKGNNVNPAYIAVDSNKVLTITKSRDGAQFGSNYPTLTSMFTGQNADLTDKPEHGRTFGPGFYIDVDFAFDQKYAQMGNGFPCPVWMNNFWDGQSDSMEIDLFEAFPQIAFLGSLEGNVSMGFFNHDYAPATKASTYPPDQNAWPMPRLADLGNPVWDGVHFYNCGLFWETTKRNGIGTIARFFERKEFVQNRLTYSKTGKPSYPPNAPVGAFSTCENPNSKGFSIFVTAGNGAGDTPWPMYVRRWRVFGLPGGMTIS